MKSTIKNPSMWSYLLHMGWVWIREGSGNKGGGKRTPHYAMAEERESVLWS